VGSAHTRQDLPALDPVFGGQAVMKRRL